MDILLLCATGHTWIVGIGNRGDHPECPHDPSEWLCGACGAEEGRKGKASPMPCPKCGTPMKCRQCAAGSKDDPVDPRCPVCRGDPVRVIDAPKVTVRGDGWERVV